MKPKNLLLFFLFLFLFSFSARAENEAQPAQETTPVQTEQPPAETGQSEATVTAQNVAKTTCSAGAPAGAAPKPTRKPKAKGSPSFATAATTAAPNVSVRIKKFC